MNKIAYFSPLPPKRTGIAVYSRLLLPALADHLEIELFDQGPADPVAGLSLHDYDAQPGMLTELGRYRARIYHLGNNPHYHLEIYHTLQRHSGLVVLHDAVLYFLVAGQGPGGLAREFCLNYGADRLQEFFTLQRDCPEGDLLRYPYPERYPLLGCTLAHAQALIVHSDTTRRHLLEAGFRGEVHTVPMITAPPRLNAGVRQATRAEWGLEPGEVLVGCFGFIGRTKRMPAVLEAMARLNRQQRVRLLIAGIGDDLQDDIHRHRLEGQVIQPGYISDMDYDRYLEACDIVVNLRYPSMGETSLTLIQAMAQGKACIVTDHAWFSELPDDCVRKISYGEQEVEALTRALGELAEDTAMRDRLATAAAAYVSNHCLPDQVAARYRDIITAHMESQPPRPAPAPAPPDTIPDWAQDYFQERLRQALDF